MAAGERVFLREQDSEVLVEFDKPTLQEPHVAQEPGHGVLNEGTITATGGKITLAAGDIYSQVISNIDSLAASFEICNPGQVSNTGTIEARSDTTSGGIVIAKAADVTNSGTIDVTGNEGGEVNIEATGRLGQLGIIHADGTTGNGGNVELRTNDVVALGAGSLTTANAGANGDGGEVVVYSPDTALFHDGAKIEAKGGAESGNGGFVEVSGKKHIEVFGQVDASAEAGEPGTFLIDPINIIIQDCAGAMDPGSDGVFTPLCKGSTVSGDAIEEWLNNGVNVEINASYDDTKRGNITQISDAQAKIEKISGGDATIKLVAHDITLDGGIVSTSGKLGVILDADDDVILTADIITNGGDFTSSGDEFDNTDGPINTIGGAVKIEHLGEVKVGRIDAREGDVVISAGVICEGVSDTEVDIEGNVIDLEAQNGAIGPLQVVASNQLNAKTLKDNSDIIISSIGDLPIGLVEARAGNVTLIATGKLTVNSVVSGSESADEEYDITLKTIAANQGDLTPSIFIEGSCAASGKINVSAQQDVRFQSDASRLISWRQGNVEVKAGGIDEKSSGGEGIEVPTVKGQIYMAAGTAVNGGAGTITMLATGDIRLSRLETTNGTDAAVIVNSGGQVKGRDSGVANIEARSAILEASDTIGDKNNAVYTDVAYLTAKSEQGDIVVLEEDDVTLQKISALGGSIDIKAPGDIKVSDGAEVEAQSSIKLHSGTDGTGDLSFEPGAFLTAKEIKLQAGDEISGDGKISKIDFANMEIKAGNSSLVIWQDESITDTPAHTQFAGDDVTGIDLHLLSNEGSINSTMAHGWKSITANAQEDITLKGTADITANTLKANIGKVSVSSTNGDVVVNGDVSAGSGIKFEATGNINIRKELKTITGNISVHSTGGDLIVNGDINARWSGNDNKVSDNPFGGGVELLADSGRIYSSDAGTLNVSITGYSNDLGTPDPMGVKLPGGTGRAGIVIISHDSLHLGPGAVLSTYRKREDGETKRSDKDDRDGVYFMSGPPGSDRAGDPIDVSVYLASTGRDVIVDSKVNIYDNGGGAMVIDAREKVDIGASFAEEWVNFGFPRLEVVSRTTKTLEQAATNETLPGAEEILDGRMPAWIVNVTGDFDASNVDPQQDNTEFVWSKYVLRGRTPGQVLAFADVLAEPSGEWRDFPRGFEDKAMFGFIHIVQKKIEHSTSEQIPNVPPPPVPDNILQRLVTKNNIEQKPLPVKVTTEKGVLAAYPETPIDLQTGNIIETPEDALCVIKFSKDTVIIVEPNTIIKIGTMSVSIDFGKISFSGKGDPNHSFEINKPNGDIRITNAVESPVRVIKDNASFAESGTRVEIGPVLSGELRVSSSDIPPSFEDEDVGYGRMAILEGKKLSHIEVFKDVLEQTYAKLKDRLNMAPELDYQASKLGQWPFLIVKYTGGHFNNLYATGYIEMTGP